jgi:hypothetical protein
MYGDDLHEFGLENVARCIGWVMSVDEVVDKLQAAGLQIPSPVAAGGPYSSGRRSCRSGVAP